jgi:hypothetical protein
LIDRTVLKQNIVKTRGNLITVVNLLGFYTHTIVLINKDNIEKVIIDFDILILDRRWVQNHALQKKKRVQPTKNLS